MAGVMALRPRDDAVSILDSAKVAIEVPSKLHHLSRFQQHALSRSHSDLLLPQLLQLLSDRSSPVRKLVTQIIGEFGSKHVHLLPEIVPALIAVLQDDTPAVSRQAITSALVLFRSTLVRVAVQGLLSGKLEESIESSWALMLKLKEKICSIAFQPGSDGIRLLALKFVEAIILLYTPDPNGSLEPPPQDAFEGKLIEFNISWLRGGHPLLNVEDLSIEAIQSVDLLLDHLRLTAVKSLSNSTIIVLINCLSAIANKRPAFYGRIVPVLIGLDPSSTVIKGVRVSAARHALKNAFLSCLKCTHPGAPPWRDRLAGALGEVEGGCLIEEIVPVESQLNEHMKEALDDLPLKEEEKPSVKSLDVVHGNANRKRSGGHDIVELTDDIGSEKRVKTTPTVSEGLSKELNKDIKVQDGASTMSGITSQGGGDTVQHFVAMFGAVVAQGDKAAGSLEILISSVSSDVLAGVVMANMQNLPHDHPSSESIIGNDALGRGPSSMFADILSLSRIFLQMVSQLDAQPMESNEVSKSKEEEECLALTSANSDEVCGVMNVDTEEAVVATSAPVMSTAVPSSRMEKDYSIIPHEIHDVGNLDSGIPGLDATNQSEGFPNTLAASSLASTDLEDGSQEQASSVNRSPCDQIPSVSTDRFEELSPKASATDANSIISSPATSVGMSYQIVLPKMSAPVIDLADEQKDCLQNLAFLRIIEAYKQIALAGGSHVHFRLLASLGVEFPLELDPWKLLQKHILSDYVNHEGHELTLHVLYRLFGEAEEERDFFSSATATSSYDMFLLTVAKTLRDSFPASDKSLSRLLGEVPYLPESVFKLLECMCSPENSEKDDKGLQCGDRVTQGLFAVWSLILLRPSSRNVCLKIALQSAVHNLEEVRMKAIRLVANKLYPLSSIAQQIEEFAMEKLFSVSSGSTIDRADDEISIESHRDSNLEKPLDEHQSMIVCTKDAPSETELCVSESLSLSSISEAQRCMSLYFALCTKKHSLFRQLFVIYRRTSEAAKQAVDRHIPILVRTIGSSPDLLEIISDPPIGSQNLLKQVLRTLTDGVVPSPALTFTIKKLYDSKLKDVEILMPILSFLPKEEVLQIFPKIVNLPQEKFQAALSCVMQGSIQSGPVLTPSEVLIAIHGIDPDRDAIPLKKITDACNACFEQRKLFTQQVIAKVLNQLVEQIPLPLLFMRTVLQAIGFFPALVDFIMEILSRLVSKQIWKYPKLWVGFLKCAFLTKPQSFSVLLQLPPAQLENALNKNAALKAPLVAHANQPDVHSSLPRSVLAVLGVASDSQTSSQTQATPTQTDTSSSEKEKEVVAEKTVELSSAS